MSEVTYWAGSMKSLEAVEAASKAMMAFTGTPPEHDGPRLLSVEDGVATINVHGPLTNTDSPFNALFGVTSYGEIRDAFVTAAQDAEVKHILMDVSSGGGAVSGVEDTARLIEQVGRIKPVTGYADTAASAAYWLLSGANKIYASKTAMVGSIGVIARHAEQVDAMRQEGITVTTVRAGSEKALANPYEKLTDAGKAQIQQQVDAVYKVFVDKVANSRGKSYSEADATMAQGKEFIGQAAVDAGLIDGIKSYDEVVSEVKRQSIDQSKKSMDTRQRMTGANASSCDLTGDVSMTTKKTLTEQEIVAIAAGVSLEATDAEKPETVASDVVEGEPEAAADTPAVDLGAVKLLKEQLASAQTELLAARVENAKLSDKLTALEADVDPLKSIVAASINTMSVALGGSRLDLSALSARELSARHQATGDQFKSKFPVGGVAAVVSEDTEQPKQPQVDPRHLARVNAVRFSK